MFVIFLACAGCSLQPRLMHGDANFAQVEYANRDLAAAMAIAKAHCARFEKVPRYIEASLDVAWYDCVHR